VRDYLSGVNLVKLMCLCFCDGGVELAQGSMLEVNFCVLVLCAPVT